MSETFIYVIEMGCEARFVKIGVSDRPDRRLSSLQTGNPYPLTLSRRWGPFDRARAIQLEGMLHRLFREHNAVGEWFAVPADQIAWVLTKITRMTCAAFDEWVREREQQAAVL